MKKITNIAGSLLLLLVGGLLLTACKKTEQKEFNPERLFTPGRITVATGETKATLTWNASLFTTGKDIRYTVELAHDSSFQTIDATLVVDTSQAVLTDSLLVPKQKYVARIKANAYNGTPESKWEISRSFSITGEQIFFQVFDTDLTDSSVLLKWRATPGLTKIVIQTAGGGTPRNITLDATDIAAAQKRVTGLTQLTAYTAEIYSNAVLKGTMSFTTKEKSIFTRILAPGDDLVAAVADAANGDVIGLKAGTYDCKDNSGAFTSLQVLQKTISIQSVSNNPADTKVNFKEVTLSGTGAGITLKGIEFDGTAGNADYFINFRGATADADPAVFTSVLIDNCIVHNTNNCLVRGNRGANNGHKVSSIKVNNSITYANGGGSYHYFMLDKMEFQTLEITNSTMYDGARAFIRWNTNLTVPVAPTIVIDHATINGFGFATQNYVLLDANANTVNFSMKNSILANTPKPGQEVGTSILRAGSASAIQFNNNNYFNLNTGGTTSKPLTFPSLVQMSNNQTIDLGWTATTNNFTLAADSPLRTAGENGGPIGDPRWAK